MDRGSNESQSRACPAVGGRLVPSIEPAELVTRKVRKLIAIGLARIRSLIAKLQPNR